MDAARIRFVFGDADLGDWDLTSETDRELLLAPTFRDELSPGQLAIRVAVANQILDGDPPETWATAQRLTAAGLDREETFRQLATAIAPRIWAAVHDHEEFDRDAYLTSLAQLPTPTAAEFEAAVLDAARSRPGVELGEVEQAAAAALGLVDHEAATVQLDRAVDALVDDDTLVFVSPNGVAALDSLTDGIVLTHRLGDREIETGVLVAGFDLAPFCRQGTLRLADGAELYQPVAREFSRWAGPDDWLAGFAAGTVVAVQVPGDGVVDLTPLADAPPVGDDLARRLRAAYDAFIDEPWLPQRGIELIARLLVDEPAAFAEPRAPLAELAAAAGLEVRGSEVAHDDSVWHNAVRKSRLFRLMDVFDDDEDGGDRDRCRDVLRALDVADLLDGVAGAEIATMDGSIDGPVDETTLRRVLAALRDTAALTAFSDELFDGYRGTPAGVEDGAFVDALVRAATRSDERRVAHYLAALHAERRGDPQRAAESLQLAHQADPSDVAVLDRLAWYASVRGDVATAVRLWRQFEPSLAAAGDVAMLERLMPSRRDLGRNEPCWCGSGRKYKQCHLGATELPALPDRVGWLCRKAIGYLERRGAVTREEVVALAAERAVDTKIESIIAALEDPIVMDLALTEGGWFEVFLDDLGELLPDDEQLLARSWTLVERTVYEVLDVRPGGGLDVRDLRSGDTLVVREQTFSRSAQPGELVCARAVPDGVSHQFIGGLFPVRPGTEADLLDLLDDGDPQEIAAWAAAVHRPPRLSTREGEELVECDVLVDVGDVAALVGFLDEHYERDDGPGDVWHEMFQLDDDETIVRATLTADGARLAIATMSEERADRVLDLVLAAFPDADVLHDRREPIDIAALPGRAGVDAPHDDDSPEMAVLADFIARYEERWCDESVPALGGLTPREAAADPTRREEVIRLIASFEQNTAEQPGAMRPARLRELLDL